MTIREKELYITGGLAFLSLVTYCVLAVISFMNWNEAISGILVGGFVIMAKDNVSKMFQMLGTRGEQDANVGVYSIPVAVANQSKTV
jgi:hypothetical protein